MDSQDEKQIRVRFITKDASIRVTETPFAVPLRLARHGLSQIVNHLLDTTTPFDFLIENKFLRTSLAKYVRDHPVSEEAVLTLEYVQAVPEPNAKDSQTLPDWIGAVDATSDAVAAGCYDGSISVRNLKGEELASINAHAGAIKALALNQKHLISGGKDHAIRVWTRDNSNSLELTALCNAHGNSIESLALKNSGDMFASGGWDGLVNVWTIDGEPQSEERGTKKQRTNDSSKAKVVEQKPLFHGVGHTGCVSGVCFTDKGLVSGSWDRSVRLWDLEKQLFTQTMTGNRPIIAMDVAPTSSHIIATAHPDHAVRIWDDRAASTGESAVKTTLQSHKKWVSSVQWQPNSEYMLLSGAFDGSIKLWDIRSTVPLYTVEAHEEMTLDIAWADSSTIVSGGDDCKLKIFAA